VSGDYSSILVGHWNKNSGSYSTILGGINNMVDLNVSGAFVVGSNARAYHSGSLILADGGSRTKSSDKEHSLTVDFQNGIYFDGIESNLSINLTGILI
jgi:hypothetical protein